MMKYRNLRIAWSVAWGVVAVLLVVMWVRSYLQAYEVLGSIGSLNYGGIAHRGRQVVTASCDTSLQQHSSFRFAVEDGQLVEADWGLWVPWQTGFLGFDIFSMELDHGTATAAKVPSWFFVLLSATFAALPKVRLRFSLRTLFITTTLVAVVLGAIVYATRG